MNNYLKYYEEDPIHIERASLHREIRNMMAEQNMPPCQKTYLEMLEDMYQMAVYANVIYNELAVAQIKINVPVLPDYHAACHAVKECDATLEKWENHLLRNSFCSCENC